MGTEDVGLKLAHGGAWDVAIEFGRAATTRQGDVFKILIFIT